MSEKQDAFESDLYVGGQRPFCDSQMKRDGIYIVKKDDPANMAPLHIRHFDSDFEPGIYVEMWNDGEFVRALEPGEFLTECDFFREYGEAPGMGLRGSYWKDGHCWFPQTALAEILLRRS